MNISAEVLFPFLFILVISIEEIKPTFDKRTESWKKTNVQKVPSVCYSLSQHCVVVISFDMNSTMLILQTDTLILGGSVRCRRKPVLDHLSSQPQYFYYFRCLLPLENCVGKEKSFLLVLWVNFLSTSLNMIIERRHFNQVEYMIIHGVRIRSNLSLVVKSQRS